MKLPELNAFPRCKAFAIDAMAVLGKKLWQKSGLKERANEADKKRDLEAAERRQQQQQQNSTATATAAAAATAAATATAAASSKQQQTAAA
jgi:adenylate kinase